MKCNITSLTGRPPCTSLSALSLHCSFDSRNKPHECFHVFFVFFPFSTLFEFGLIDRDVMPATQRMRHGHAPSRARARIIKKQLVS
jgi:hypothetical protein